MSDRLYFRAWTGTQMLSDVAVCNGVYVCADWSECEDFTVMQCTGLKDKNGKLIYEADILKDDKGLLYLVKYVSRVYTSYCLERIEIPNYYPHIIYGCLLGDVNSKKYEVIGNKYENKELLESEEK